MNIDANEQMAQIRAVRLACVIIECRRAPEQVPITSAAKSADVASASDDAALMSECATLSHEDTDIRK